MVKKTIEPSEGRKITSIIHEIHTENSSFIDIKTSRSGKYSKEYYQQLASAPSSSEDNEEYDEKFIIFRNILVNRSRAKYSKEKLLSINSFIKSATWGRGVYGDIYWTVNKPFSLEEYLSIIEKNESWLEYLLYLVNYGKENNCRVIFDPVELNEFCLEYFYLDLKYLSYIIDIKKIEYRDRYLYSEPKRLQDIENSWRNEKYDEVIDECRNSLLTFVDRYRKEHDPRGLNVKKDEKPKLFKEFFKEVCDDYKIEGLTNYLDEIFKILKTTRNLFGKGQPGASLDEKKVQIINKKVNTRMLIDFTKAVHNLLVLLISERKRGEILKEN